MENLSFVVLPVFVIFDPFKGDSWFGEPGIAIKHGCKILL